MPNRDSYAILESIVRQTFATVVWTHKIQEKQGDIHASTYHWMEVGNILCASLTSAGIISSIFFDEMVLKVLTAIVSFVTIFCGAYFKSFNVQESIAKYRVAAQKLVAIRNQLLSLLADLKLRNKAVEALNDEYKVLLTELHKVYAEAPATTKKAVDMAREALVDKQDYTFTDEEIDIFIPAELRKGAE